MTDRRLIAEPIMAWKRARIVDGPTGRPAFGPLSAGGTYGVDEVAECRPVTGVTPGHWSSHWLFGGNHTPATHDAGVPDPACACGFYATKERADPLPGQVTLRVALTGTVIVHRHGYRAQRQQVQAIEIPRQCTCYIEDIAGLLPAAPYRAVCHRCAPNPRIFRLYSLADLASAMCVDVSWCHPYPPPRPRPPGRQYLP